jgi:hypothetical protein
MSDRDAIVARANKNIRILRRLNNLTLSVAIIVYLGLIVIAMFEDVAPLILFSSCIMLAEILVFQTIKTLSDHFDLMRTT